MEKICVIGLGYIGLPTAIVFAKAGFDVLGVDTNSEIVEQLKKGRALIKEKGLNKKLQEAINSQKLKASLKPNYADVFIIAVPTPITKNKESDVSYVIAAINSIIPYIKNGNTIIIESTIPPRTIKDIIAPIIEKNGINTKKDIYLAHCPERVLPGKIFTELVENNRIIGGYTKEAAKRAGNVFRKIMKNNNVIETDCVTAEMTKLMENTYRDVNIALANELVKISKKLHINAYDVIELANNHSRVNIHLPGPGVGGHCLAVDPYFITEKANKESKLISLSRDINLSMPKFVIQQIQELIQNVKNPKIAILGLTYKANIDDIRESPSIEIVRLLKKNKNYRIYPYDPYVKEKELPFLIYGFQETIRDADLAVVLVDHNEFCNIDSEQLVAKMRTPIILDCKNCLTNYKKELKRYVLGDNTNTYKIKFSNRNISQIFKT